MKLHSLKIPAELDQKLREEARRKHVPVSTIVRQSISAYLARGEVTARPGSFLEAAKDLVGCVEGGPADLSSNPLHMAGYGEHSRRIAARRSRS